METKSKRVGPADGRASGGADVVETEPPDDGGGGGGLVGRPKPRGESCIACREAKTRCVGRYPCNRCFAHCIPCKPQVFPRKGKGHAGATEAGGGPLLELAFTRHDPRPLAASYLQVFWQVHEEGLVDRGLIVKMLRMWCRYSLVSSADCTWGIVDAICGRLGVPSWEVHGPGSLALDAPPEARRVRALAEVEESRQRAATLKETYAYHLLVERNANPAWLVAIDEHGRHSMLTNEANDCLFRDCAELYDDYVARRTMNALTLATFMAPEDRQAFFRAAILAMMSSTVHTYAEFLKMVDREGNIGLYILHGRRVQLALPPHHHDHQGEGRTQEALIVEIEPAPPSRHVMETATLHRIVKRFRSLEPGAHRARQQLAGGGEPSSTAGTSSASSLSSSSSLSTTDGRHQQQQRHQQPPALAPVSFPAVACVTAGPHGVDIQTQLQTLGIASAQLPPYIFPPAPRVGEGGGPVVPRPPPVPPLREDDEGEESVVGVVEAASPPRPAQQRSVRRTRRRRRQSAGIKEEEEDEDDEEEDRREDVDDGGGGSQEQQLLQQQQQQENDDDDGGLTAAGAAAPPLDPHDAPLTSPSPSWWEIGGAGGGGDMAPSEVAPPAEAAVATAAAEAAAAAAADAAAVALDDGALLAYLLGGDGDEGPDVT